MVRTPPNTNAASCEPRSRVGDRSKWASSLVLKLVDDVARKHRLRVGYSEFNDETFRLSLSDADGGSGAARALAERRSHGPTCAYTGEPVSEHADEFSLQRRALARARAVRERGAEALAWHRPATTGIPDAATARRRRAAVRFFSRAEQRRWNEETRTERRGS